MWRVLRVVPVVLLLVLSGMGVVLPAAAQGQVYTDTMDSEATGLLTTGSSNPAITNSYQNGQYLIQISEPSYSGQTLRFPDVPEMSDVRVGVDVALGGDPNGKYVFTGCRMGLDSGGYWFTVMPATGRVVLYRFDPGELVLLQELTTSLVNPGNANNTIGIECVGSTVTGILNGQNVLTTTDATYATGASFIGVGATGDQVDGVTAGFDNLTVADLGTAPVQPTVAAPTVAAPTVAAPTVAAPTLAAPTVAAPTVAAPTVATGQGAPIRDPNVDPDATLSDAFTISMAVPPTAGPFEAVADVDINFVRTLPAGVQVADFYAELHFVAPTVPAGTYYLVGFCFWHDPAGNCYDVFLSDDGTGNVQWGYGFDGADGNYQSLASGDMPAGSVDPTPGAVNFLSLTVYQGVAILSGETFSVGAVIPLEGAPVAGEVKAEVGYIQISTAAPTTVPTLSISISDFAVWDLSSGQVPGDLGSTVETPAAPVATATTASLPTVAPPPSPTVASIPTLAPTVASAPTTAAAPGGAPILPPMQMTNAMDGTFDIVRTGSIANQPLVAGGAGVLAQTTAGYTYNSSGTSAGDLYALVSFTNPTDMATPVDVGIGFRASAGSETGVRFVVMSTGGWYLMEPSGTVISSGQATNFDPAPGAINTVEVIAQGNFCMIALNGTVVTQAELPSGALGPGDVYIGTGFFQGDSVEGRQVPWSNFWIYPLSL